MNRIVWMLVIVTVILILVSAWSTCNAQVAPFVVVPAAVGEPTLDSLNWNYVYDGEIAETCYVETTGKLLVIATCDNDNQADNTTAVTSSRDGAATRVIFAETGLIGAAIWVIHNPSVGSHIITTTQGPGTVASAFLAVYEITGANASAAARDSDSYATTNDSAYITLTSVANDLCLEFSISRSNDLTEWISSQTQTVLDNTIDEITNSSFGIAYKTATGASTVMDIKYTNATDIVCAVAITVKP